MLKHFFYLLLLFFSSSFGSIELLAVEVPNQDERDFIGYDYAAWAYDLFNPDAPYSDRGLNPNGNGYDRYIYGNKLTDAQCE